MLFGYARVSTRFEDGKQTTERQEKILKEFGCEDIRHEYVSGGKSNKKREELNKLLEEMEPGSVLVVSELSRATRSLQDLTNIIERLEKKSCYFVSISDNIDTRTDGYRGKFLMQILGAVSELQRNMISENVKEGVAIAREKGRMKGRQATLTDRNPKVKNAARLYREGLGVVEICEIVGFSRDTFYRKKKEYPKLFSVSNEDKIINN